MLVNVQIKRHMLHYRERAQSKCGSFDYMNHTPGGRQEGITVLSYRCKYLCSVKMFPLFLTRFVG